MSVHRTVNNVDVIELLRCLRDIQRVLWDHVVYCSQTYKSSMRSRCLLFAVHTRVLWDHVVYCSQTYNEFSWDHVVVLFAVHTTSSHEITLNVLFAVHTTSSHEIMLLYCSNSTYNEFSWDHVECTVHRHTRVLWDHVVYCSQNIQEWSHEITCCTVRTVNNEFSWDHVVVLFAVHTTSSHEITCLLSARHSRTWSHEITLLYCSNSTYKSSHEITLYVCSMNSTVCNNEFSWDHLLYCSQYIQRVLMRSRCCTVHSKFNEFSWDHVVVLFADIQEFYEITLFTVRRRDLIELLNVYEQ